MKELWSRFEGWLRSFFYENEAAQTEPMHDFAPLVTPSDDDSRTEDDVAADLSEQIEEETSSQTAEHGGPVTEEDTLSVIGEIKFPTSTVSGSSEESRQEDSGKEANPNAAESGKQFEKLLSNTVSTIKYYDAMAAQVEQSDVKMVLEDVSRKLIENLILSGCTPIDSQEGEFDMTRHRVIPFQMVADGTPYRSLVRAGVEWDGEVRVLAIVSL